ncbi:ABC transporter ATP-binding protein [Roseivirga sp.]|uniref:ABC transporter ATP-binding protein n=1 Tax=Roseivirga sp. TaxID=1964215 RepID=UPI003B52801B
MSLSQTILSLSGLSVGYTSKKEVKTVLSGVKLNLEKGQLASLLGANGSGKSTLIRTIAGVQKPLEGTISIAGKSLEQYSPNEVARLMSLVLAQAGAIGNLTVYALVSLGRFPYTSWMGGLTSKDKEVIFDALEAVGIVDIANRHIDQLSDGQRQKVMIARALAQDTELILLDEPTAHLDFPNKLEVMHLLRDLAFKKNKAILISSHDLDSALSLSDQLWLIDREKQVHAGVPEDLVLSGHLENAFAQDQFSFDYERARFRKKALPSKDKVWVEGPSMITQWLRSALERNGHEVSDSKNSKYHIRAVEEQSGYAFYFNKSESVLKSIEQLLIQLKQHEEINT